MHSHRAPHPKPDEMSLGIDRVVAILQPLRDRLLAHPVYAATRSPQTLRVFMEHHVFAVWDFMSLVKAVQRRVTCVDVPWIPRGDGASRRFIHEIVLSEESDEDGQGGFTSHFELYLEAMRQSGAGTSGWTRAGTRRPSARRASEP